MGDCYNPEHFCSVLLVSYEQNTSSTLLGIGTVPCADVYRIKPEWYPSNCTLKSFFTGEEVGRLDFISRIVCYGRNYVSDFMRLKLPSLPPSPPNTPPPPAVEEQPPSPPPHNETLKQTVQSLPDRSPVRRSPRRKRKRLVRRPVATPPPIERERWVSAPGKSTPTGFRLHSNVEHMPYYLFTLRNPDIVKNEEEQSSTRRFSRT